ncbi:MAG: DeoR/GlpR family DNA-binding transcription regulator [Peptoniphilaceae bacterium]|nr:DeoR/GlpR family DNA-binding transcription regulator [Peptoniphilaceae bacterium]MDD7383156.1 DeoR/GlpR family DNA-binding transcription regulator [Peptoniphilaceae bacterium]MDY3738380.1 DeoR/GlpR family DNA-binding transcription regulator [Peptoniphilaceae bacterium]
MPNDRLTKIANYIISQEKVSIDELVEKFKVSKITIRRDLDKLEKKNIITKIYGGAQANSGGINDFETRANLLRNEKQYIAQKAALSINSGDSIFMDGGTTASFIFNYLDKNSSFTLLTNSLDAINKAVTFPNILILIVGNSYDRNIHSFINLNHVTKDFSNITIDKAFITCSGVSIESGLSNKHPIVAGIKSMMCSIAKEVYLLADNSKFDKVSLMTFYNLEDVDKIFTDKKPNDKYMNFFEKNNIEPIF